MKKLNSKLSEAFLPLVGILMSIILGRISYVLFYSGLDSMSDDVLIISFSLLLISWFVFLGGFYKKTNDLSSPFYWEIAITLLLLFLILGGIYYSFGQFIMVVYILPKVVYFSMLGAFLSHIIVVLVCYFYRLALYLYNKVKG